MLRTTSADLSTYLPRPVLAIFITYEFCFSILGIALTQLKCPLTPPESGVVSNLVDARKSVAGPLAVSERCRGTTCARPRQL